MYFSTAQDQVATTSYPVNRVVPWSGNTPRMIVSPSPIAPSDKVFSSTSVVALKHQDKPTSIHWPKVSASQFFVLSSYKDDIATMGLPSPTGSPATSLTGLHFDAVVTLTPIS